MKERYRERPRERENWIENLCQHVTNIKCQPDVPTAYHACKWPLFSLHELLKLNNKNELQHLYRTSKTPPPPPYSVVSILPLSGAILYCTNEQNVQRCMIYGAHYSHSAKLMSWLFNVHIVTKLFIVFFFLLSFVQQIRQSSKESTGSSDSDSSSDDESTQTGAASVPVVGVVLQPDKIAQQKETEAGAEISALVNYVQPVHFSSFEMSESKKTHWKWKIFVWKMN